MLSSDKGASNDPGTIKITIRKFYRVSGASTQLKGVASDIVLPDVLDYSTQVGEVSLDNPLPWDTIQPANYEKFNLVQPYLATLKARSNERVVTNQDFLYVKQDIDQFLKSQSEKTATINEHDALKEHERAFLQNKTRDAERSARKLEGVKVYDITVKNSELPGLVEAGAKTETNTVTSTSTTNATPNSTYTLSSNSTKSNLTMKAVADKKSPPPFDPQLDEAQQILLDYISLLGKNHPAVAN